MSSLGRLSENGSAPWSLIYPECKNKIASQFCNMAWASGTHQIGEEGKDDKEMLVEKPHEQHLHVLCVEEILSLLLQCHCIFTTPKEPLPAYTSVRTPSTTGSRSMSGSKLKFYSLVWYLLFACISCSIPSFRFCSSQRQCSQNVLDIALYLAASF